MTTRRDFLRASASTIALAPAFRAIAMEQDLTLLSIAEASEQLRIGALTSRALTEAYLARIERLNPSVNAYITVTASLARQQAGSADTEIAEGRWRGPLHGIPIALKDNIDTADIPTTAASEVYAERIPAQDAVCYRRLRTGGAVLLGKLNMHEFAYGGTSSISHFGPVHNPWNLAHIPGGSSGGSAAAVAAGLCAAALGTDTLASIRQPAAYCGVVGLKATHGLASIRGIIPVSESLDHVGPLCRTVSDAALVMRVLAGYDAADPVSRDGQIPDFSRMLTYPTRQLRVGIPRSMFFERLHPDVQSATTEALALISGLASEIREVDVPDAPSFVPLLAEAYAYHETLLADETNHDRYHPVTLERLLAAGQTSAADYINGRRQMVLARAAINTLFDEIDVLVTPTTPGLPESIANAQNPAEASGAEDSVRNTAPFNVWGIPTISVPCGFSAQGLPIGLQFASAAFREPLALALAAAYQRSAKWPERAPA